VEPLDRVCLDAQHPLVVGPDYVTGARKAEIRIPEPLRGRPVEKIGARNKIRVELVVEESRIFHGAMVEVEHVVVEEKGTIAFLDVITFVSVEYRVTEMVPIDVHGCRCARGLKN
jgi:hypothetical protein